MIKSNSKKAKRHIMNYIREDMDYILERAEYDGINESELESDPALCYYIYQIFKSEKGQDRRIVSEYTLFKEWASGLALGGMFLYYYNVSAVETLGDILEETAEERARFTEDAAEEMLTRLIYREIVSGKNKCSF